MGAGWWIRRGWDKGRTGSGSFVGSQAQGWVVHAGDAVDGADEDGAVLEVALGVALADLVDPFDACAVVGVGQVGAEAFAVGVFEVDADGVGLEDPVFGAVGLVLIDLDVEADGAGVEIAGCRGHFEAFEEAVEHGLGVGGLHGDDVGDGASVGADGGAEGLELAGVAEVHQRVVEGVVVEGVEV